MKVQYWEHVSCIIYQLWDTNYSKNLRGLSTTSNHQLFFITFYGFTFFVLSSIFILSGISSVDLGLPIVSVPGGCTLGSRCPLPFCHQQHHLHIHPSSFAEVIWSLLSSSSFICPSSCFHCSFCALPEQTSSTSTKVCTLYNTFTEAWTLPLSVLDDLHLGGCWSRTRDLCHCSLAPIPKKYFLSENQDL